MAKKKRKASKAKPAKLKSRKLKSRTPKRAGAKSRPKSAGKTPARKKTPARPRKVASAFQLMIDTINETERRREKRERRGSDETA
jgi:hypothetical protein